MIDGRVISAALVGVAGLVAGIVAAAADTAWLGAVAGAAALVAGGLAATAHAALNRIGAEHEAQSGQIAELEEAMATQMQARLAAEEAVRSLGEQLNRAEKRATDAIVVSDASDTSADAPGAAARPALTDSATGLYSEDYFHATLEARIAAARRHLRPVAVVLLELVEDVQSDDPRPANPLAVSESITTTLREADTACRLGDGRFSLVLEDTPENGAIWTIERIRRHLADHYEGVTLWAGVACYPAHAFDRDRLMAQAESALRSAKDWRQDRIEVANAE